MKWSIIALCLVVFGCTPEPEPFSAEELKQRLKPKRVAFPASKSPVELVKEEMLSTKAENLQLKEEIRAMRDKIENNDRKINTYKIATKRENRDCPAVWK